MSEQGRIDPLRPDPDVLLARLKGEGQEPRTARGRLRIYLGMAPGVGKTFAMLNEGRRRRERGTDVVAGFVETYGRPKTIEAIGDLEIIPRRLAAYRGVTLEEMDTAAVIARRPAVALVDELAHTNAPGSTHEKRWQDVEALRDARIDVISTLNVQHLDSLNDQVENLTGVRVRETVPDRIFNDADEVEIVDISPEALRARMRHGNIYPPAQAAAAMTSFFRIENLAALRKLALQRTAQEVDEQLDHYMRDFQLDEWKPTEWLMACVSEQPVSKTVLRRAWRLASAMRAELLAVHVDQGGRLEPDARLNLESHLRLAEDLGARVIQVTDKDIANGLSQCASA